MNGKEVPWFRHDFNARNDERMQALNFEYGMEGVGRYWCLVEILREQSDYRLPITKWTDSLLAAAWGSPKHPCSIDEANAFLSACESIGLVKRSSLYIWSESLLRRMKMWEKIVKERRKSGKAGGIASGISRNKQSLINKENNHQSKKKANALTLLKQNEPTGVELSGLERSGVELMQDPSLSAPPPSQEENPVIVELMEIHKKAAGVPLLISDDDMPRLLSLFRQYDGPSVVAAYRIHQKEKPGKELRWFLKDFAEYHAKAEKQKANHYQPDPLHTERTPEEELHAELEAARFRQSKREKLTNRDKEVLGITDPATEEQGIEDVF